MAKLIAFYSRADENYFGGQYRYVKVGNTEKVAKMISDLTGADMFKIEQKVPYSANYKECVAQSVKDLKSKARPELVSLPNLDDYTLYIGPPLLDTFRNICRFNEEESARGVEIYREYYNTKGKLVNKLYDGIDRVLAELKNSGAKLAVCSSKYEKFAEEITDLLGVYDMFDAICGSTLDGSRKDKKDLIPYAVERLGGNLENDRENIVMIGDTWFDTKGARLCGVDFVGVEYGYGDLESMKKEGGRVFVKTTAELLDVLTK